MKIQNVTVCGLGILGEQIVFQTAFYKFNVVAYDIHQEVIENVKSNFFALGKIYKEKFHATEEEINETIARIFYSTDLTEATENADLVIEAIPENLQLKKDFFTLLDKVAPAKSIFCTNSSTFIPSMFASETNRPERILALHFLFSVSKYNIAEIMGHIGTDPIVLEEVVEFAKEIKIIAVPIYKEQAGHIFNSLLMPFLNAALSLYFNGISDPQTIDRTWMLATDSPIGPFGICDGIGLTTLDNVIKILAVNGDRDAKKGARFLKKYYIDKDKLGISTGEGFYTYPLPLYQSAEFLTQCSV